MKSGWVHCLNNLMTGPRSVYPTLSSRSKASTVSANTAQRLGDIDVTAVIKFLPTEFPLLGVTSDPFGLAVAPINHADPVHCSAGVRLGNVKNWVNMSPSFDYFPLMGGIDKVPLFPPSLNLFFASNNIRNLQEVSK